MGVLLVASCCLTVYCAYLIKLARLAEKHDYEMLMKEDFSEMDNLDNLVEKGSGWVASGKTFAASVGAFVISSLYTTSLLIIWLCAQF